MGKVLKKCAYLLLALAILAGMFAGCKGKSGESNTVREIVSQGKSEYKIIIGAESGECTGFAAEELQNFIERAASVRLEIVEDMALSEGSSGKYISVGDTVLFDSASLDAQKLGKDGFVLRTDGDNVLICGMRERATLYGVYDFLEKYVGVRFLTDDYTFIPEVSKISVSDLNETEVPDFEIRSYWTTETQRDPLFAARRRTVTVWNFSDEKYGGGLYDDFYNDGHNVLRLLGEAGTTFEAHPECYASINGERKNLDICWTNGVTDDGELDESMSVSTAKSLIEGIKARCDLYPTVEYFMIAQEDSQNNICTCSRCNAVREKYGSYSSAMIRMINLVAREVQTWADSERGGRPINIVTMSYEYSEQPPVRQNEKGEYIPTDAQVIPEPNVFVQFAPLRAGNLAYALNDPLQDASTVNNLAGWLSLTNNLFLYTYTTNFANYLWYVPDLLPIGQNIRYFRDLGISQVICEGGEQYLNIWQAELRAYIYTQMMWDADLDPMTLAEEYFNKLCGAYADEALQFLYLMEDSLNETKQTAGKDFLMRGFEWITGSATNYKYNSVAVLERAASIAEDAAARAAEDPALEEADRERIVRLFENMSLTPRVMIHCNYTSYYSTAGWKEFAYELYEDLESFRYLDILKGFNCYFTDFS